MSVEETEQEQAWFEQVDEYIAQMKWADDTPQETRALVAGNVRGFAGLIYRTVINPPPPPYEMGDSRD